MKPKPALDGPHFETRFKYPGEVELAAQVKDSARWAGVIDPKFGLELGEKPALPPPVEMPEPEDWPRWMTHQYSCEACYQDGWVFRSQRVPCYSFQRSHFVRS